MRSYPIFIIATVFILAILLSWVATTRYHDFITYQKMVSQQITSGVANEVALVIKDKKRLVNLFAEEQAGLLKYLVNNPDSEEIHYHIRDKLREYFPDYFVYTIADNAGEPYFDDFEGNISELCVEDITGFLNNNINHPRIHPNPNAYHFDIMGSLLDGNKRNVLFVSFHANLLGSLLKNSQSPEHTLMLVVPGKQTLIEVTATGPRNKLKRLNYLMNPDELNHILSRTRVNGTSWEVVDLANPYLFPDFKTQLIFQSLMIFVPFLLFAIVMWYLFYRASRLRAQAENARDEFLATISHELRTPLTAIHGSLGLVANGITGQISTKTAELIDIAVKNSQRLILLVNDLLDMRKLESGKMDFDMQIVSLAEIIHHAIDENRNYMEQYNNQCELDNDGNNIYVRADKNRLIQVMTNLLSNATKYGKRNDIIKVHITPRDGMVRISVFDKGDGIPPEFRPNLFHKFTQHDSSDSRSFGGSGLGLSIVKAIIEAHKGIVGYTSYRDVGTTFYFDLPVIKRTAQH